MLLASGDEERNTRWADLRRRYNAGTGVHSLTDLHTLIAFFEERRGRLYGFRWRYRADWKSCAPDETPAADDQDIGTGDGATAAFQLVKSYGGGIANYVRAIAKPVAATVKIAVDGVEAEEGTDFVVDTATGIVTFSRGMCRMKTKSDGRLRVRRAGELRHGSARREFLDVRGRGCAQRAAGGDQGVGGGAQ